MPCRDGTGSEGMACQTGRGRGSCRVDSSASEATEDILSRQGRVRRRDRCRDCGRGKGLRKGFPGTAMYSVRISSAERGRNE